MRTIVDLLANTDAFVKAGGNEGYCKRQELWRKVQVGSCVVASLLFVMFCFFYGLFSAMSDAPLPPH